MGREQCDHDWQVTEVHLTGRGADMVEVCTWCGALSYGPSQAARRPPLDPGPAATT